MLTDECACCAGVVEVDVGEKEMPDLGALYDARRGNDLLVIGVAVDYVSALMSAKRAGASRAGIIGAALGTVAGIVTAVIVRGRRRRVED